MVNEVTGFANTVLTAYNGAYWDSCNCGHIRRSHPVAAALQPPAFEHQRDAVLVVAGRDLVGGGERIRVPSPYRDTVAGEFEHRDVVVHVAERNCAGQVRDRHPLGQLTQSRRLRHAVRRDLDQAVVGRIRDVGAVADQGWLAAPAIKLLIRLRDAASEQMRAVLAPLVGDRADITYSTNNGLIEISAHGVTKASGLRELAERMAISDLTGAVAFGDMPNDVPMLELAGHGVAMRNAHPDALAAADEITAGNDEDGVALVLERWWL